MPLLRCRQIVAVDRRRQPNTDTRPFAGGADDRAVYHRPGDGGGFAVEPLSRYGSVRFAVVVCAVRQLAERGVRYPDTAAKEGSSGSVLAIGVFMAALVTARWPGRCPTASDVPVGAEARFSPPG